MWVGWGFHESQFGLGVSGCFQVYRQEESLAVRLLLLQGENRFQETVEEEGMVRGFGSTTLSRHDGPRASCVVMNLCARCVEGRACGICCSVDVSGWKWVISEVIESLGEDQVSATSCSSGDVSRHGRGRERRSI